jgi:hypothetical protein
VLVIGALALAAFSGMAFFGVAAASSVSPLGGLCRAAAAGYGGYSCKNVADVDGRVRELLQNGESSIIAYLKTWRLIIGGVVRTKHERVNCSRDPVVAHMTAFWYETVAKVPI